MTDSYRPRRDGGDSYNRARREPSPPPMYHFGASNGNSYRPDTHNGTTDSYRPGSEKRPLTDRVSYPPQSGSRRDDFTFRSGNAPQFPAWRPTEPSAHRQPPKGPRAGRQGQGGSYRGRGSRRPLFHASDRPILRRGNREGTPEQMLGVSEGGNRFIDPDELSESETDMDLDSADDDAADSDNSPEEGSIEPAAKKVRRAPTSTAAEDLKPKWSNPDPYTSLPPPDESQAKKKDVVQLIRKAKVEQEKKDAETNGVTENADFISFNFDDNPEESDEESSSSDDSAKDSFPPSRAGHSGFSHLDALHPDRRAPRDVDEPATENRQSGSSNFTPTNTDHRERVNLNVSRGGTVVDVERFDAETALKKTRYENDWSPPPLDNARVKKRKREELDGRLLQEWLPRYSDHPTPWCNPRQYQTEHVARWLHHEIQDFYAYVRPKSSEEAVRKDLISRITQACQRMHPGCQVLPFGSFAAGLYLPTADMDVVLISPEFRDRGRKMYGQRPSFLHKLKAQLERAKIARPGGEVIFGAKVPILKFVDSSTGLRVDMSFENLTGVVANETFHAWKVEHPAMPILVTLIKQFLLMRGLNEVFTGGLGGFSVTCLVTSLLQNMPAVQSGNLDPSKNLGQILMEFFDFYSNKFNLYQTRISMNPPGYMPKGIRWHRGKLEKPDRLSIVDPNDEDNDISQGSHKVELVFQMFGEAYKALQNLTATLHTSELSARKGVSVLGCIIAGDYSKFESQRARLERLFVDRRY